MLGGKIKEWSRRLRCSDLTLEEFTAFHDSSPGVTLFLILTGVEDFCRGKDTLEEPFELEWRDSFSLFVKSS